MDEVKMEKCTVTVLFTKDKAELLAHLQIMPNMGEGHEKSGSRWIFNIAQFASQSGIELPEGTPHEYTADSEAERDKLAESLLDAALLGRKKADELRVQVRDAFVNGLPKKEETVPDKPVAVPGPPQS